MQTVIYKLTDSQIKALPTTPITIATALGSGVIRRPIAVSLHCEFSAGAYTNIDATYAELRLVFASGAPIGSIYKDTTVTGVDQITNSLGTAADRIIHLAIPTLSSPDTGTAGIQYVVPLVHPAADLVNQAIRIEMDNNGTGALTGGNAANYLRIYLYYVREIYV